MKVFGINFNEDSHVFTLKIEKDHTKININNFDIYSLQDLIKKLDSSINKFSIECGFDRTKIIYRKKSDMSILTITSHDGDLEFIIEMSLIEKYELINLLREIRRDLIF